MKKLVLTLLSVLSFLTLYADENADMENPRFLLVGQGNQAMAEGRYMDAAARFSEAINMAPEAPEAPLMMSNLAMAYFALGNDSLALNVLDTALERTPAMTTLHTNRARVLLGMGRDREAYDIYTRLLAADSLNAEMRYYHGMIALYSGDAVTAETDFNILSQREPSQLRTARALAALYSLTGRDVQAIPQFEKIIAEDPQAEYYAALAGCQLALHKLSDASATIGEGMRSFPDDPELLYYRAWLRRDQFRPEEARADLRRAVSLGLSPSKASQLMPE